MTETSSPPNQTLHHRRGTWVVMLLAIVALVLANLHEIWCFVARESDPRTNVGDYAIILHNAGGYGQVVVRTPDGKFHEYDYRIVRNGSIAFLGVVVAVLLLAPVVRKTRAEAIENRRIARRAEGMCGKCAYNLKGNQTGTCPECGTPVQADSKG